MTLYIVSTPIGNLEDISVRALRILKECDYILCEDTRHSLILLRHYSITTPLKSFHKFKEARSLPHILADLELGKTIALISDAGTPLLADPGESLVAKCLEVGISVSAIPGACAVTTALVLSGFPPTPFQFLGFLPKKKQELKKVLSRALLYTGTTLFYETPHRIEETLDAIQQLDPERELCLARELTKLYEECLFGTAEKLQAHFVKKPPKGEMVLLLKGCAKKEEVPFKEFVAYLQETFSLQKMEAIKLAADVAGLPKREVYKIAR